jgi:hypothetical protein
VGNSAPIPVTVGRNIASDPSNHIDPVWALEHWHRYHFEAIRSAFLAPKFNFPDSRFKIPDLFGNIPIPFPWELVRNLLLFLAF